MVVAAAGEQCGSTRKTEQDHDGPEPPRPQNAPAIHIVIDERRGRPRSSCVEAGRVSGTRRYTSACCRPRAQAARCRAGRGSARRSPGRSRRRTRWGCRSRRTCTGTSTLTASGLRSSATTSIEPGWRLRRFFSSHDSVRPESMMSSTISTCWPAMSRSRSLRIRTTPEVVVRAAVGADGHELHRRRALAAPGPGRT